MNISTDIPVRFDSNSLVPFLKNTELTANPHLLFQNKTLLSVLSVFKSRLPPQLMVAMNASIFLNSKLFTLNNRWIKILKKKHLLGMLRRLWHTIKDSNNAFRVYSTLSLKTFCILQFLTLMSKCTIFSTAHFIYYLSLSKED